tara:strand:- start:2147 stop:2443 length:297 start_codon:yes stop_codon:yes gene_type:complete
MYKPYIDEFGQVKQKWCEPEKLEKPSKNQRRKLLKGYYSKEKHVEIITALMHGKYYQRKANNPKGLIRGQLATIRFNRDYHVPVDIQAHKMREAEKRA